jgi:hypothetical protein
MIYQRTAHSFSVFWLVLTLSQRVYQADIGLSICTMVNHHTRTLYSKSTNLPLLWCLLISSALWLDPDGLDGRRGSSRILGLVRTPANFMRYCAVLAPHVLHNLPFKTSGRVST